MMKIAQFTALPMAVVAIQVNDKTTKKALKKAIAAGMVAAVPAVTGQTCSDNTQLCSQRCEAHGFMQNGECWGADDNRCVVCVCNDGTDLSSTLPLDCNNPNCGYDDRGLPNTCPGSSLQAKAVDEPTCSDNTQLCSERCESHGFMQNGECWGADDNRCVVCVCNDGTDLSSTLPLDCNNPNCGYDGRGLPNTCPGSSLKAKAVEEPSCYETNVFCAQSCAAAGLLVHRTECYGAEDDRCMICACNDDGTIVDISRDMPLACTSSNCGYDVAGQSDACPGSVPVEDPAPTCYETNVQCAQTCAGAGLLVQRTECYGADDNRCMICSCNDGAGTIIDISDQMPLACTSSNCGYAEQGQDNACPTARVNVTVAR